MHFMLLHLVQMMIGKFDFFETCNIIRLSYETLLRIELDEECTLQLVATTLQIETHQYLLLSSLVPELTFA